MLPSPPAPEMVEALEALLVEQTGSRRRPTVAAAVLALIVELYQRREPFPKREAVAEILGCSVFGIDTVLSRGVARGHISLDVRTFDGKVADRPSTSKHRYFVPSREILLRADIRADRLADTRLETD